MSAISLKSITGITSITTPAGVDDQLTLHNNNTTERVKIDVAGNVHINNQLAVAGVTTMSGNLTISNTDPRIIFTDTNNNPDFTLHANSGAMQVENSGSGTQVKLESSGSTRLFGNVIANKDLDVDGHTNLDNVNIAGIVTVTTSTQYHGYKLSNGSNIVGELVGLSGSNDTGALSLWHGGSKYVQLSAQGESYISGGNVGINSTVPRGKLDIGFAGSPNYITFGSDADNPKVEFFRPTGGSPSHYATEIQMILGDLVLSTATTANLGSHSYNEKLRINSAGRVIVGHSQAIGDLHGPQGTTGRNPFIQLHGANASSAGAALISWKNSAGAYYAPVLYLAHSGSDTVGTNSILPANGEFGSIVFSGDDGTDFVKGAMIKARLDGTPGNDDMPGRLEFYTTSDGAQAPVERLRISSNGDVRVGSGAPATFGSGTTVHETYNASTYVANLVTSGTHQLQMIASQTHGATSIGTRSNHNLNLCANDLTKMTITTDGKIGINQTPTRELSLHSPNNNNALIHFTNDDTGETSSDGILVGLNGNEDCVVSNQESGKNIIVYTHNGSSVGERLRIASSGNIGIDGQASPQAKLHIGNYETTQNENQSSVTQYFIDSTRSLKIARCNRGSVSNAGWYDVAVLSDGGFTYRCQVSIGGNFTKDVVDIEVQMAYGTTLGNKYSMQIHARSACAHSNDRITHVRVAEKSNVFYLQVKLQNVNSQVNGKSVLESTCGIYAQNGADNAYPMFAAASGSYSNICTTFPDFGVHASWDMTVNSSGVRSYTALTGGSQIYVTAENAGSGTGSHGTVGRFTAPMRGLYQVNLNAKSIINPSRNQNILLSMYGSMTYDSQNVWTTNSEVYDPRGAVTGSQGQQGEGNSWYLRMAAYDYFSIDWYRPAATGYINGGGDTFNISILKMG